MGIRILVVDDEDVVRSVIRQVLTEDGHDVIEANSGEEALELFREQPTPIVLSDIYMGGMSGIDLLQKVREIDQEALVVIMTSNASLDTATSALRAGAHDYLMKPFEDIDLISAVVNRAVEKIKLMDYNRTLLDQLKRNAEELESLNARLQDQANRDGLTGLYNHRYFRHLLDEELKRSRSAALSLIFMDLDHFKHYNDTHGHPAGDELLKDIAEILRQHTKSGGIVARYGGEEFVLALPGVDKSRAQRIGEQLRVTIEQHDFQGAEQQPLGRVTMSLGLAIFSQDGEDGTTLIEHADQALYEAKRAERNKLCTWDEMSAAAATDVDRPVH